jgi:hypothetical protein
MMKKMMMMGRRGREHGHLGGDLDFGLALGRVI